MLWWNAIALARCVVFVIIRKCSRIAFDAVAALLQRLVGLPVLPYCCNPFSGCLR